MNLIFKLVVLNYFFLNLNLINAIISDPYEILSVKKSASINEIKRNYKNLVKIWHPDKTDDPKKEEKFFEINEAYKILMDPLRREDFDKYKVTEHTPNFNQNTDYSHLKRFDFDPYNSHEDKLNNTHHQTESSIYLNKYVKFNHLEFLHKQTISHKAYSSKILPSSVHHLQLILFYSDLSNQCSSCSTIAPIWNKISNELFPIGIHLHTINVDKDRKLAVKIGINTNYLPAVIGITDEIVRFYKDDQINSHKIILFVRKLFRNNLIQEINDQNLIYFLNEWKFENKVRVLFLNHEKNIKLRYLATAFKFKEYASFGHFYLGKNSQQILNDKSNSLENTSNLQSLNIFSSESNNKKIFQILNKYNLDFTMKYMLIFNENSSWPIASLSSFSDEIKPKLMWETLDENKFLLLPKITSQKNFEQICPVESIRNKRILCTILIVSKKYANIDFEMQELRNFIKQKMFSKIKFKFAYITLEDQKQFVSFLISNQTKSNKNNKNYLFKIHLNDGELNNEKDLPDDQPKLDKNDHGKDKTEPEIDLNNIIIHDKNKLFEYNLSILVISRTKWNHVFFEWLDAKWDSRDLNFMNKTKDKLYDLLIRLSSPEVLHDFTYETNIISLVDESEKNLLQRIFHRIYIIGDHLNDHFTKKELLPIFSVVLSILFVALIGYIMQYLVKMEERKIEETYKKLGKPLPNNMNRNQQINLNNKLLIHELKGETYNGLVRLLKPGCRTIVLLCDLKSRHKLLPKFYKAVYPYRRNKTLMFGYLMIEKNLDWYRKILEQALDKQKVLHLNPKNCIGTVLSLNGFRKYFCVYHAKHMELQNNGTSTEMYSDSEDSDIESGNLLNENPKPFLIDKNVLIDELLLEGLNDWLEKLFNAKTHKYFISYWPTHMK